MTISRKISFLRMTFLTRHVFAAKQKPRKNLLCPRLICFFGCWCFSTSKNLAFFVTLDLLLALFVITFSIDSRGLAIILFLWERQSACCVWSHEISQFLWESQFLWKRNHQSGGHQKWALTSKSNNFDYLSKNMNFIGIGGGFNFQILPNCLGMKKNV